MSARLRAAALAVALLGAIAADAAGQEPGGRPRDPDVAPDSAVAADSAARLAADSLRRELETLESLPDSLLTDSLRVVRDSLLLRQEAANREAYEARRAGLAGGDFPEKDAWFEALAAETGFEVVQYRGEKVRVGVPGETLDLEGSAQLNRSGNVLVADTIRWLGARRFMEARRSIELLGSDGQTVVSDSVLYYDIDRLRGTVFEAESTFDDGGTEWRVFGNVIPLAQDTIYATESRFTSCDLEEPHYTFRAGELKMVSRDVLVAWPVVLYVSRVPVFWLPFFAADIRQGRRSGIIPPRFGLNDIVQSSGQTSRNITDFGYYWAISDYMDAQATVDWYSGNYTQLNGAFRYHFLKQFIRGSVVYSQSFAEDGNNLRLRIGHDQELGLNTTFRASVNYVEDTRIFQDQSVNPTEQTQTIDSDIGFNHRFGFGNLQAAASRQQYLDNSRITTTLPRVNFSVSPVTLFAAPRNRAGPFNNVTLDGSTRFSRTTVSADSAADRTTTDGGASANVRVGNLTIASTLDVNDVETTPQDSLFVDLPSETRTRIGWTSRAAFQINLVGSTRLSPTARIEGGRFRSVDTDDAFVDVPGRAFVGATLTTDVFGFWPGFGPFSRLRHKISPAFDYSYSPEVDVDSVLAAVPGFPVSSGMASNRLSFSLNQTIEAKLPGNRTRPDSVVADTLVGGPLPVVDSLPEAAPIVEGADRPPPTRPERDRIVTLLGLRTSALVFDFARPDSLGSSLITEQISNSFTSDLLRGFTLNMTHDLFSGSGDDRKFSPYLTSLRASFSLSSGQSIGDIFGVGGQGAGSTRPTPTRSIDRIRDPEIYGDVDPFAEGSGPWNVSLTYSLQRPRPDESGLESQSLQGSLSLRPTSHWSVRWTTQYNFTEGEFGQNVITLDRDLHRWLASFQFARSPNGNTVFQVALHLRDAPDVRTQYNQRTD